MQQPAPPVARLGLGLGLIWRLGWRSSRRAAADHHKLARPRSGGQTRDGFRGCCNPSGRGPEPGPIRVCLPHGPHPTRILRFPALSESVSGTGTLMQGNILPPPPPHPPSRDCSDHHRRHCRRPPLTGFLPLHLPLAESCPSPSPLLSPSESLYPGSPGSTGKTHRPSRRLGTDDNWNPAALGKQTQ